MIMRFIARFGLALAWVLAAGFSSIEYSYAQEPDYDDDTQLDFVWTAPEGTFAHYNVYVSVNGLEYQLDGTSLTESYTVAGQNAHSYGIKMTAVTTEGTEGPFSPESAPVVCDTLVPLAPVISQTYDVLDQNTIVLTLESGPTDFNFSNYQLLGGQYAGWTDTSETASFTFVVDPDSQNVLYIREKDLARNVGPADSLMVENLSGDNDSDGIPNYWEYMYSEILDPGDPSDADIDSDGDGWSNYEEFIAGTDPTTEVSVPQDTSPPAPPTDLTTTAGDFQVWIDWDDNAEMDLAGYKVHCSTEGEYVQVNVETVPSSDYLDTGLTNGVTYHYYVTAVDESGNESGPSDIVSATPGVPPSTYHYATADHMTDIGHISAGYYVDTQGQEDLAEALTEAIVEAGKPSKRHDELSHIWTFDIVGGNFVVFCIDACKTWSPDGDDFHFSYSNDGVSYVSMLTVTKTTDDDSYQCYILPNIAKGTIYIRVHDTDSSAGNRNLDTLYVDHMYVLCSNSPFDLPPQAPQNVVAVGGDGQVSLDWDDNLELDIGHYCVYRSTVTGGSYAWIDDCLGSTYVDVYVANGTRYYYVVTAVDSAAQESSPCKEASVTPGLSPSIRVGRIEMSILITRRKWSAVATVIVLDKYDHPVEGATVSYTWSGVHKGSGEACTDANGEVTVTSDPSPKSGTTSLAVANVSKVSFTYDEKNSVTSDSVSGP